MSWYTSLEVRAATAAVMHFHVSVQVAAGRLHFAANVARGPALVEGGVVLQAVGRGKHFAANVAGKFLLLEGGQRRVDGIQPVSTYKRQWENLNRFLQKSEVGKNKTFFC